MRLKSTARLVQLKIEFLGEILKNLNFHKKIYISIFFQSRPLFVYFLPEKSIPGVRNTIKCKGKPVPRFSEQKRAN